MQENAVTFRKIYLISNSGTLKLLECLCLFYLNLVWHFLASAISTVSLTVTSPKKIKIMFNVSPLRNSRCWNETHEINVFEKWDRFVNDLYLILDSISLSSSQLSRCFSTMKETRLRLRRMKNPEKALARDFKRTTESKTRRSENEKFPSKDIRT